MGLRWPVLLHSKWPPTPESERPLKLVPYGVTGREFLDDATRNPVPVGWRPRAEDRVAALATWKASLVEELARVAWPRFVRSLGGWRPEDTAYAGMEDLTRADLGLLPALQDLLQQIPYGERTHRKFFEAEDAATFGSFHNEYDATLPIMAYRLLPQLIHRGLSDCVGSLVIQLKEEFQRPRAFQLAFRNEQPYFRLATRSADHPSFPSGHGLQGLVGTMHAYLSLRRLGYDLTEDQRAALVRLATHIGDRRVMAGVHYPSDSVGSWIVALRLVENVVAASEIAEARRFVAQAILASPVHAALAKVSGAEPHTAMWRLLDTLMAQAMPRTPGRPDAAPPEAA